MIVVRSAFERSMASWSFASFSASSADVASSRTSMGASRRMARARASLWRCPPERSTPLSPSFVSYPSGNPSINSAATARCAARSINHALCSDKPSVMFLRTVAANILGSCGTYAMRDLRSCRPSERMSYPSSRIDPPCGSYQRINSEQIVLFPAPDCPTIATVSPGSTAKLRFCMA